MSEQMCAELKGIQGLLDAQVAAGMDEADVKESLCRSWVGRITSHPALRDQQKAALTSAITEGPWDASQKKLLASSVLASGSKASKAGSSTAKRANQKAHSIENLISMQVMAKLKDVSKFSMTSRLSILASHVRLLGIENPDNITLFRMVGIVAVCDPSSSFDQEKVWDFMNTLQKFVKSGAAAKVEYIVDFPPTAELLPTDIQRNAFPDGILPPELSWPELDTCLAQFKKRGERTKSQQPLLKGKDTGKATRSSAACSHDVEKSPLALGKVASEGGSQGVELSPPPLPSPDLFRLRADSQILPHESLLANKLAPVIGSEQSGLCRACGKAATEDADHVTAEAAADLDLDAFESGMMKAIDARVRKRPASSGHAMKAMKAIKVMKKISSKPAAADHKGRKPVPGWSMQRRLKEYPKGCAKCANNSPGCTPSCFRSRGQI